MRIDIVNRRRQKTRRAKRKSFRVQICRHQLLYVALLSLLSSCDLLFPKLDFSRLPPETQEGAHTLGCYIDGKMFFGGYFAPFMDIPLSANYALKSDILAIHAYGYINADGSLRAYKNVQLDDTGIMLIVVSNPKLQTPQPIKKAEYTPITSSIEYCYLYRTLEGGEVYLSKFDTVSKIVSGRFRFDGICSDKSIEFGGSDSSIVRSITEGRFDLRLRVSNN